MELTPIEVRVVSTALKRFRSFLERDLAEPLTRELRGFRPRVLDEVFQELDVIGNQLAVGDSDAKVHGIHRRMLKSVIAHRRRELGTEIDGPRQRTGNRDAIVFLEKELRVLDHLTRTDWFIDAEAARLPRLTDFLSLRYAEAALGAQVELLPRVFDEKFGILEAPTLFMPDLGSYRKRCRLRQLSCCVAFVDIDDFKRFNTVLGETRVDQDILPAFMEIVERHVFSRGHAYRFGGDEYVLLLPNSDRLEAVAEVQDIAASVARMVIPKLDEPLTISAGVCHVSPDCVLTDREVLERANQAERRAKASGKNRVTSYGSERYREEDIVVHE